MIRSWNQAQLIAWSGNDHDTFNVTTFVGIRITFKVCFWRKFHPRDVISPASDFLIFKRLMALSPTRVVSVRTTSKRQWWQEGIVNIPAATESRRRAAEVTRMVDLLYQIFWSISSSAGGIAAEWPRPLNSTIWCALLIPSSLGFQISRQHTGDNFSQVNVLFRSTSLYSAVHIGPFWNRETSLSWSMLVSNDVRTLTSYRNSSCCWLLRRSRTLQEGLFLSFCWQSVVRIEFPTNSS